MTIAYARVSTQDQNLDRQIDALTAAGVDRRNIYAEKMTGTKRNRPELERMLEGLQTGDVVIITDLTRISRSTRDLLAIVDKIRQAGAGIRSLKDTWLDTTSTNPYNDFLLVVMSGLAALERDLIVQRTREGLESARARGRVGGRPRVVDDAKADQIRILAKAGVRVKEICETTGISRSSVYRALAAESEVAL